MSVLLGLIASPLARGAALVLVVLAALGGLYLKGRMEGRAACLAEGERDVLETISRADRARAAAERDGDAGRLREDDSFRRD
ncbi:hypothetical protein [Ancylobacter sp. G4_0304]|uniref:hypothetical protein n=1 Tax=Ancylobacter sp. G4_0304 TaxID=3114289 RepID=UPI0039C6BC71